MANAVNIYVNGVFSQKKEAVPSDTAPSVLLFSLRESPVKAYSSLQLPAGASIAFLAISSSIAVDTDLGRSIE